MNYVARWSPRYGMSRDITNFQDEVNRLFDGFFGGAGREGQPILVPPVDVEETQDEFLVRADLPGVSAKDVKVNLLGDTLTIRGAREEKRDRKDGGSVHRMERTYGTFERSFSFGTPVKNDGIQAIFKDGVLEIHVPKAEEAKQREIEVKVAS